MVIAYKGFHKGLTCMGYQFVMGKNVTEKANCRENGFHCAENPLDCLNYYPDIGNSEYCIVAAGGDLDEDGRGSCPGLCCGKGKIPSGKRQNRGYSRAGKGRYGDWGHSADCGRRG